MLEQLQQVDTSVIDELMEIKQERETIATRLAKMIEDQSKVSDVVFRRVKRDYESRVSALERKAAPLKDKARQEYAKLKVLLDRIESQHQATKLDREEIDFRHRLGEFEDGEFKKRTTELDDKLDEQTRQLEETQSVREQFLGAFDSESELATPAPPQPQPVPTLAPIAPDAAPSVTAPAVATPPAPPLVDAGITAPQPVVQPIGVTAEVAVSPPPATPQSADGEPDGTVILAAEAPPPPPPAAAAGATALLDVPPPPPASAAPGKTVVLVRGKLIAIDTDLGATEFSLEPLTFIGRTPENQIRLNKPAVSRRHAQIAQSESGYVLRDLNSENGTYVNGEKVKEKALGDGDRVQIGTVRFVFRAG